MLCITHSTYSKSHLWFFSSYLNDCLRLEMISLSISKRNPTKM
jgi:hypothetical protein